MNECMRALLTQRMKAAFLGLTVEEFEERLAPPVWMPIVDTVLFRSRPELSAFRTDGATAARDEFLVQQEELEVVTGECANGGGGGGRVACLCVAGSLACAGCVTALQYLSRSWII